MPKGNQKGSAFEREICKALSRWWTDGERDDVFWRSSQSGGRATQRAKKGQSTYGSYGDVAAVDPIGEPLLKVFTIELKRGRSHGCPGDLLDFKSNNGKHPFVRALSQAIEAHKRAGSKSWMLIGKRDCRCPVVFLPIQIAVAFSLSAPRHCARYRFEISSCGNMWVDFIGMPFDAFLRLVSPEDVSGLQRIKSK